MLAHKASRPFKTMSELGGLDEKKSSHVKSSGELLYQTPALYDREPPYTEAAIGKEEDRNGINIHDAFLRPQDSKRLDAC